MLTDPPFYKSRYDAPNGAISILMRHKHCNYTENTILKEV